MSSQDDLKERFLRFREKKYAVPLGLAIAILVGVALTSYVGTLCFGALLVAIVGFYVPYYFGLKDRRKLAVWGLVFIVVLSVPFTWFTAVGSVNSFDGYALSSPDGLMVDGHVDPFRGDAGTSHSFNVTVTNTTVSGYDVNVIIVDQYTFEEVGNHTLSEIGTNAEGVEYGLTIAVDNGSLFSYRFVTNATGGWTSTVEGYGPVHAEDNSIFVHFLPMLMLALLLQVGLLYYMLLAFNWFSERSRKRMEQVVRERQQMPPAPADKSPETVEKFVCSECGADVPSTASRCPQCGESFDDEALPPRSGGKAQFECSECGAAVDEGARTCWNCGKEFEE
jgi:ribosomal protein L40E